jgi:hypothetical protein
MAMRGYSLFLGATYATRLRSSSAYNFASALERQLGNVFVDPASMQAKLRRIEVTLTPTIHGSTIGHKEALEYCLQHDLNSVIATFGNITSSHFSIDLERSYERYVDEVSSHGIVIKSPLRIVDNFPRPYRNADAWAIQCDADDVRRLGIKTGIYFRRELIAPVLSQAVLAHEVFHACFAQVRSDRLARGLEEGLAEIIGFHLSSKLLGREVAKNVFANMLLQYPSEQTEAVQRDSFLQAVVMYQHFGLEGIWEIMRRGQRKGREEVKRIEKMCLTGSFNKAPLPKEGWTQELNEFCDFISCFPYNTVISPLAYYLAEKMHSNQRVSDFLQQNNVSPRQGRKALRELQDRVYLILLDKDKIVWDETKEFLDSGTLRYELN